jgi:exodeoxyribonuclease III
MKLISWNVNGIRAAEKKGLFEFMLEQDADVYGLQETKAHKEQLHDGILNREGYTSYWSQGLQKGYSGTAVYTKVVPISYVDHNEDPILRNEGRINHLEFEKFHFFNVYFPNGGRGGDRLIYKLDFYKRFLELVTELDKTKPVIFCGDVNTAHKEIDLARPKENVKTSGFMPEEREWVDKFIEAGYVDAFRKFNQEPGQYSYWDQITKARTRNVGWRIDYFFVSEKIIDKVKDCRLLMEVMGSDHCPVVLEIEN